jgi:hypothetical protein
LRSYLPFLFLPPARASAASQYNRHYTIAYNWHVPDFAEPDIDLFMPAILAEGGALSFPALAGVHRILAFSLPTDILLGSFAHNKI